MKAFVISLCVFTLVLGVTVWNSVYIGKVTSELEAISNECPLLHFKELFILTKSPLQIGHLKYDSKFIFTSN